MRLLVGLCTCTCLCMYMCMYFRHNALQHASWYNTIGSFKSLWWCRHGHPPRTFMASPLLERQHLLITHTCTWPGKRLLYIVMVNYLHRAWGYLIQGVMTVFKSTSQHVYWCSWKQYTGTTMFARLLLWDLVWLNLERLCYNGTDIRYLHIVHLPTQAVVPYMFRVGATVVCLYTVWMWLPIVATCMYYNNPCKTQCHVTVVEQLLAQNND